ncbi:hypothetical protein VTK56DRAFT_7146 [Thermocarpiscus australiensis]
MGRWSKASSGAKSPRTNSPQPNDSGFGGRGQNTNAQRTTPFSGSKPSGKQGTETSRRFQPGGRSKKPERPERSCPSPSVNGDKTGPTREPTERTKQLSQFASSYANKLYNHLKKDNINPPQWPAELGNPNKRGAVEALKDAYKKYRTRVYASLRKADLIDDPEKRRKLEDALPFKGICEDMCPEFEQVSRIAEYDVKTEEKETLPDGRTMWPDPSRMVKKFARSAAGQDAPLPMDVRSVDALRRTTDYLFNDLLQSEDNLPSMHNFLWDRTRAVRKDFTFHSQKSAEEMKDMVYCFEAITRFHATALHLLSRKGFASEDFDQKQEIDQLGRTILSLVEAYDVCRDKRVACENEAEFRAYYLLLNAHDPSIAKRIPAWGRDYWFESEEVQTALSLIRAMDDVREPKGPLKPRRSTTLSDTSFTNYFAIVEDPRVSYTMACIAEIHFTTVRQGILKNLVRGYARRRDAPRTITASDLNQMLRFDTVEEAIEFAELHDFQFTTWVPEGRDPVPEPYLLLNNKKQHVPSPRVRQSFSGKLVERKRTTQSLPYVIYNTIYEEPAENLPTSEDSPNGLFVSQTAPAPSENTSSAASSTAVQPPRATAATQSPFGVAAKDASLTNGIPSAGGPVGTSVSPFSGLQTSQQTTPAIPSPFAALSQLQAQAGKTPFSFLNQSQAPSPAGSTSNLKPGSVLGQPAQPEQPTVSNAATSKPALTPNPFAPLGSSGSTPAPSVLQTVQQPGSALPSTPTLLSNAGASKSSVFSTLTQSAATAQSKPAESAPSSSSSTLGSAPQVLPRSTEEQATILAAPGVPRITLSSPPQTGKEDAQPAPSTASSRILGQPPVSSVLASQILGPPVSGFVAPPKPPQLPKRDLMGDFTKWFVKGDDGLMEEFIEGALDHMLRSVFEEFRREEAERKRKEEDEESWRLAREHQNYRLRVKYFYRWRDNARALATKRILREGKAKMRLYREQQKVIQKQQQEEKQRAEREARKAAHRQLLEDSRRLSHLASSAGRRYSVPYSANHDLEEQLLASGIFSGLRDERGAARAVVNGDRSATPSRSSLRHPESELEFETARSARESAASPDSSVGRREGWKTRSLRERFGIAPRRSVSGSGSVDGSSSRFGRSLPAMRTTNFSRKRSAEDSSDDEPGAKRRSVSSAKANGLARSRHWDLRARGFVPMPDGNWLPEAVARSMQAGTNGAVSPSDEGPALADVDTISDDAGSRVSSPTPSDLRLRLARLKQHRVNGSRYSVDLPLASPPPAAKVNGDKAPAPAPAPLSPGKGKRKRGSDGDGDDEEEEERELSPSAKRPIVGVAPGREETNAMVENTRRMLRELREYMDRLDRDGPGFQGE